MNFNFPTLKDEKEILKQIKPILNKIKPLKTELLIGGSFAKHTWLKDNYDLDIFIRFPKSSNTEKISEILHKHLKKKFKKIEVLHGSRDYYRIIQKPFSFEIVPIIKINKSSEAKNITDISPLHVTWVNKHISTEKLSNEVRKAKLFCKANNVYGAESFIKSFSGYSLEILISKYKSLENLLKNALKWKIGDRIDLEKHGIKSLNHSKLSPLIIIDPVQYYRNAAAALSQEKFLEFKKIAESYLKKPSDEFFIEKKVDDSKYNLIIKAIPLERKEDVAGAKALKAFEFILRKLREFKVLKSEWRFSEKEALFYISIKNKEIPKKVLIFGPPLKLTEHAFAFKKKHKSTFEKNKRLCTYLKRKQTSLKDILNTILRDNYLKDKVLNLKQIK